MREAIQKAIEGGWKNANASISYDLTMKDRWELFTSDPLFWQCLGKALGWPKQTKEVQLDGFNLEAMANGCSPTSKDIQYNWLHHWHRFIDHLAERKDIDTFFKDLLSKGRE